MDSQRKRPQVFEYLDVLGFLQDYYKFRKTTDEKFSYQSWSEELEFQSRSFLRMIVTGKKKITAKFVSAFSSACFLTKAEITYFEALVNKSQAARASERQAASRKMLQLLRHESGAVTVANGEDFVSDPLLPRLLALLSFKDLRATSEYFARLLERDPSVVQKALAKLQEMGLAESSEVDGKHVWYSETEIFKVPDQFGSFNAMKFHESSLHDAIAAFAMPKEQRRYKSLLLPMNESDLAEFNQALDNFANDQMIRFNSKNSSGKRMYQINFNSYAVTKEIEPEF